MRNGWMVQVTAGVFFALGCAVSADPADLRGGLACEPGEVFECACSDGAMSTQQCNEAGTAVVPCGCGALDEGTPPAGTGAPPPVGAGGTSPIGSGGTPPIGSGGTPPIGSGGTPPIGSGGTPPIGSGGTSPIGSGGTSPIGSGGTSPIGSGGTPPIGSGGTPPIAGGGVPPISGGTCCPSGDCLCHGPAPTGLTSNNGTYKTASFPGTTGTLYYPTDAEPPFAAVALCGGFLNTGPEMADWGTFYASHGIVTLITSTLGSDFPDVRATKLLASVDELKAQQDNASSPLYQQMAGRYGTSGYSMGGGGTTIASTQNPGLLTSVGLAPWSPTGNGVSVPTLLLCGGSDTTAPCSMAQGAYSAIPGTTPKMMATLPGTSHLQWFGPKGAAGGMSGEIALAFEKVFLEGDERWRPFLLQAGGTVATNIQ